MRIELRDVSKHFGATVALEGIRLDVASGARVGLMGPNGSGKSTLLRALLGLVACDGEIFLDGISPFEHRTEVARQLAYVPQVAPNWGAPVREVLQSVASLRALEVSRIVDMAKCLGLDLAPIARRPFRNLSGGMKQKLLIAMALATDATLFVLDEPTASLDGDARDRFFTLLDQVAPRATRLFCSHHRDEFVDHVDRVIALADGKLVFDNDARTCLAEEAVRASQSTEGRGAIVGVPHVAVGASDDGGGDASGGRDEAGHG